MIRKATSRDLPAIAGIYGRIHDAEAAGALTTGWLREIYPTEATARAAIEAGDLFVLEDGAEIVAAARVNQEQVPVYYEVNWRYPASDDEVMVLHTLTVDPLRSGRGYGRQFLEFYEAYALENGCPVLRIDTNARNAAARAMYARRGYIESAILPTVFNGIPGVNLVCMEKRLG
ncbi:MAG: GNAT family N-acetyltransferase [Clostridia bacterium]|nr:GNAT family N-acetyltransferase [Clostridia bacterium]